MAAVIGSLRAELSASIVKFQKDLGKAADSVKNISKEFSKVGNDFKRIGSQMQGVGMALTKTVTLPILALGGASAKAAIQFESSFANVAKTVDGVSDKTGKLTESGAKLAMTFREMAKTIPATTDELTAIAALGGQMGVPIAQLEHFTKNVAALGVAVDGISTEEAASSLASIGNATGTGTTKIAEMSSALVHLGNNSNATEAQILEFTKRLVGAGHSVGMTVPEVMALGTAMANVGINAEAGGTAMSTVISKMSNAVSKGGESLTQFAKVANMSAEEFAAKWKSKPIEAVDAFVKGLSSMRERGVDLNLTMGELGTEGIRVADTLKRLSGAGDGVAKSLVFANEGFATGNKHLEEAEKKYATTANQVKVLWNRINDIGITLGNAMIPAINTSIRVLERFLPVVDQLAKAFAAMPGSVQVAILAFAGVAAALGPIIFVAGQVVSSLGTLALAFGKAGIATRALLGTIATLKAGLIALRNVEIGTGALGLLAAGGTAGGIGLGIAGMYIVAGELADQFKGKLEAQAEALRNAGKIIPSLRAGYISLATAQAKAAESGQDLVDGLEITLEGFAKASGTGPSSAKTFASRLADAQKEIDKFGKTSPNALRDLATAIESGVFQMEELQTSTGLSEMALKVFKDSLDRAADSLKDATKATKEQKDALAEMREEFFDLADTIDRFEEVAQGIELAEQFRLADLQIQFINDHAEDLTATAHEIDGALDDIHNLSGQINNMFEEAVPLTKEIGENLIKAFSGLPKLIASAFTGGGGLMGALKAFGVQMADALTGPLIARLSGVVAKWGTSLASLVGLGAKTAYAATAVSATASAATGAVAAGGGTAAGAGIIAGIGMNPATIAWTAGISAAVVGIYVGVKKLKEQRAHMEVNRLRDAFFDLHGGLEGLNPRVLELSGNLDAVETLFAARNAKQWGAAVEQINQILEVGRQRFEALQEAVGTAADKLSGIVLITPEIQAALDRVWDASGTQDQITAIQHLNNELATQAQKYSDIDAALQKYGISIYDAGQSFQQATFNERAVQLARDFGYVEAGVDDINVGLRATGQTVRAFIADAKTMGLEVPESMRRIIQMSIDAGEVFDDNGNKITDINQLGLTFGETMQTAMQTVETAIGRLNEILEGLAKFLGITLPNAAEAGAEKITDALNDIDAVIRVKVKVPDFEIPTGYGPVEGAATGAQVTAWGLQHFAQGTDTIPAMLTPGEMVLNHEQQGAIGAALSASQSAVEMHFHGPVLDGPSFKQFLMQQVWPALPSAVLQDVGGIRRVIRRVSTT